jgi:hypothetical protein
MTNPVSFRLSDDAMTVIMAHASDMEVAKGRTVDRTEALEDIIIQFANGHAAKTIFSKIRKKLQAHGETALETYLQAQRELANDQLEEAIH